MNPNCTYPKLSGPVALLHHKGCPALGPKHGDTWNASTLPGDLVSPLAGPLLHRGCHAVWAGLLWHPVLVTEVRTFAGEQTVYVLDGGAPQRTTFSEVEVDLSGGTGMDATARWLWIHHGYSIPPGATAPRFERGVMWVEGYEEVCWYLFLTSSQILCFSSYDGISGLNDPCPMQTIVIPGASSIEESVAAMRLLCLATRSVAS